MIALAVVGAVIALGVSLLIRPLYRATGTLLVSTSQQNFASGLTPADVANTDAALITQTPLLDKVAQELGVPGGGGTLRSEVTASARKDTQLIDVSATDRDPARAAAIVNALMTDFANQVADRNQTQLNQSTQSLQDEITQVEAQLAQVQAQIADAQRNKLDTGTLQIQANTLYLRLSQDQGQLATLRATQIQGQDRLRTAATADAPSAPVSPNRVLNTVVGGFAGLALGVALAVALQVLDQRLRSDDDVRERLGLPVLATVPRYGPFNGLRGGAARRGLLSERAEQHAGEAYRRLRTSLLLSGVDREIRSIVVTSARVGEGKTRTAANLAGVVAASGQQVVLVDADLRRPGQHLLFGQEVSVGTSEMLLRAVRSRVPALDGRHRTRFENLALVTSGTVPPNPAELLASRGTPALVRSLEWGHELVVIDTPPVGAVSDALSLAAVTSATVLVVDSRATNARQAREAVEMLRSVGANVIGVVLNKAPDRDLPGYYGEYAYLDAPAADGEAGVPAAGSWHPLAQALPPGPSRAAHAAPANGAGPAPPPANGAEPAVAPDGAGAAEPAAEPAAAAADAAVPGGPGSGPAWAWSASADSATAEAGPSPDPAVPPTRVRDRAARWTRPVPPAHADAPGGAHQETSPAP